jgi:hypothetical protein
MMKNALLAGFFVVLLALVRMQPASAQSVEDAMYQWIDYRDGQISVAFDQAPLGIALQVIHARTGIKIVLPAVPENQVLNLHLEKLPLEPAVRSLLSSIGFNNFALMYDDTGRPSAAVALGTLEERPNVLANVTVASETKDSAPAPQALTVEERDRIKKDLERWNDLKKEERGRIEDRLKVLPASEDRDQLVKEYGRQVLEIKK